MPPSACRSPLSTQHITELQPSQAETVEDFYFLSNGFSDNKTYSLPFLTPFQAWSKTATHLLLLWNPWAGMGFVAKGTFQPDLCLQLDEK